MRKWILIFLIAALALTACSRDAEPDQETPRVEGTTWRLAELSGRAPLAGSTVTARFEDGQVTGSAGCNSFGGQYSLDGERLAIANLVQTEMACMAPAGVMEQESIYLRSLGQAASVSVSGDRLEITGAGGSPVMVFVPDEE